MRALNWCMKSIFKLLLFWFVLLLFQINYFSVEKIRQFVLNLFLLLKIFVEAIIVH